MIGIYKYENLITHEIYIGQALDIKRRFWAHKSSAKCPNNHEYNSKLSKAIREYGMENFDFSIVKEISREEYEQDPNILNKLEKSYIKEYDSYPNGYNATPGGNTFPELKGYVRSGENNGHAKMTEKEVGEIRELWATPVPYRVGWQLWKDRCPSERCFQKIWTRETWKNVKSELITPELIE